MINKIIHGDCLEVMQNIPDSSIDAIITDPPYGTTACKWDSVIPFEPMWEQLNRIIKKNGAIVLFGSEPFSSALRMSNIKNYKYDWIWNKKRKTGFLNAKKRPLVNYENVIVFNCVSYIAQMKKGKLHQNGQNTKRIKCPTDVYSDFNKVLYTTDKYYPCSIIDFDNVRPCDYVHPTQKPIALMEYLICTYTNENETVLDFTIGSGTTAVACINTNRNFIGIEKEQKYVDIANNCIKEALEQRTTAIIQNA